MALKLIELGQAYRRKDLLRENSVPSRSFFSIQKPGQCRWHLIFLGLRILEAVQHAADWQLVQMDGMLCACAACTAVEFMYTIVYILNLVSHVRHCSYSLG